MIKKAPAFNKLWDIIYPFLLYFFIHDIARIVLIFLTALSISSFGEAYAGYMERHAQTVSGVLNGLSIWIGMGAVWPMAKQELAGRRVILSDKVRKKTPMVLPYLLLGVFAVTLALGLNIFLSLIGFTQVSEAYTQVETSQHGVSLAAGILLYGVVSAVAEEVVFRGLIYNRLRKCFSVMTAILSCGVLFGVYHGNIVQGLYGCILGIAITYIYEIYGSFFAPVLFHGLANLSVFIAGKLSFHDFVILTPWNCFILLIIAAIALLAITKIVNCTKKVQ